MTSKIKHILNACCLGFLCAFALTSAACGDNAYEEEEDCQSDADCEGEGETCVNGSCEASSSSCDTPDPSITCLSTGCEEGFECVPSDDDGCVSSACSCEDGNWTCTADCGQPHECVPENSGGICPAQDQLANQRTCDPTVNTESCEYGMECCCGSCSPSLVCSCDDSGQWSCYNTDACFIQSCEGRPCDDDSDCEGGGDALSCVDGVCQDNGSECDTPDPSVTCLSTGCEEGFECVPSDDDSCVPSACGCDNGNWLCTADCGQPHECVPEGPGGMCPDEDPLSGDGSCDPEVNTESCEYGMECCCGSCSPSLVCSCDDSGQWACYYTDACFIPSCEGQRCEDDSDCEGGGDALSCIDGICQDNGSECDTPDPSQTCLDTGCAEGFECVPSPEAVCVPSSCGCDDGNWLCTDDCGQPYECAPENPGGMCPAEDPLFGDGSCDPEVNTESCEYGMECCCGSCSPSLVCSCTDSGQWACYNTDACFIQSCEGRPCDDDSDCEGGGGTLSCVDGVCEDNGSECGTPDPSVTCLNTGCEEGFECVPSDDDSCVPSGCSCQDGLWLCTADCGQPHECVPEGPGGMCPDEDPLSGNGSCDPEVNTESCEYGMECCCGSCSPSLVCSCDDSGQWACYYTDACFIPSCEGQRCEDDSDCEGGGDALSCIDGICQDNGSECDTPDPSQTCLDTGCAEGFECVPSDGNSCVPSGCSCQDGLWLCTDDCLDPYECRAEEPGGMCPAEDPLSGDRACDPEIHTESCEYGTECCCGSCSPSLVCSCSESGQWACYYTDACFIPSCEGQRCEDDSDCEGGGDALSCIDGTCQDAPSTCADLNRDACDANEDCNWYWASGCPSDEYPTLEEDTCLPNGRSCSDDDDCDEGTTCQQFEVLPSCAVSENPNEPVCDACSMVESICLP